MSIFTARQNPKTPEKYHLEQKMKFLRVGNIMHKKKYIYNIFQRNSLLANIYNLVFLQKILKTNNYSPLKKISEFLFKIGYIYVGKHWRKATHINKTTEEIRLKIERTAIL